MVEPAGCMNEALLAHSAPNAEREPQSYRGHVCGAVAIATANARDVAAHMSNRDMAERFLAAVLDGATYHDLGKLDGENQAALRQGRQGRMRWDHIDAGVAHLLNAGAKTAAWLVRAHHAPGLPALAAQYNPLEPNARRLRGGRVSDRDGEEADALVAQTDRTLAALRIAHTSALGEHLPNKGRTIHGLFMRLALSCLVDGDHSDSAGFEHGWQCPVPVLPRWEERLGRLDVYVASLSKDGARQADRNAFYKACREGPTDAPMVACEGPVGIGKTTSVTAWLLRRAIASHARRLFVVAPYTTILSQTAKTLRSALLLPDEANLDDEIVAEHHHRADFQAPESRDLATLWRAPIIVTTGVQFFETLAACEPAQLRKLHGLAGSVVFLDEAHAALPTALWRQNWAWIRELTREWGCSFVFASGSLARVWEEPDIVGGDGAMSLPDMAPQPLGDRLVRAEHARVRYRTLGRVADPVSIILGTRGPRLAVFNTVQTAAVIADRLRAAGADVLHLSTALCPSDRDRILCKVKGRLEPHAFYQQDWTLVATSLVEAGVDLSFRTALRERFSTASLIQVGGRTNRHGEHEFGEVLDLQLDADGAMTSHPGAKGSASVLERFFRDGLLNDVFNPARLVTRALREETRNEHGKTGVKLAEAETMAHDYPEVAKLGRLIHADTALVVVDDSLKALLARGQRVRSRDLLAGSVQVWSKKIEALGLHPLQNRPGIYLWQYRYDPDFLGYMSGALAFVSGEAFII
jgi:CRISPR-associated endonuclease/helicase Cas3